MNMALSDPPNAGFVSGSWHHRLHPDFANKKADVVEHPEGIRPRRPTRRRAPGPARLPFTQSSDDFVSGFIGAESQRIPAPPHHIIISRATRKASEVFATVLFGPSGMIDRPAVDPRSR